MMRKTKRLVYIALSVVLLCACASFDHRLQIPPRLSDRTIDCRLGGGECLMQGKLRLLGGGVGSATLIVDDDCVELAVPFGFIDEYRRWDGALVSVYGRVYSRAPFPDMVWEKFEDRVIEGGMCGNRAIYLVGIEKLGKL
jgi:hypothetical protein